MANPHPFDRLLRQAAMHYRQFYPGEEVRLGRGLEIALNECVTLSCVHAGADAYVGSMTDPEVTYTIQGTHCDCPDHSAPGLRCKHRWAVFLTRIARALEDLADHQG